MRICVYSALLIFSFAALPAHAGTWDLEVEGGAVWFTKNEVRIPGDTGTKFDMVDLTDKGPDSYLRMYATYEFSERHSLRLNLAPLEVEGTGTLSEEVLFDGETFAAGVPTKGIYKFNTYRLTYRWMFHRCKHWNWGLGGALLVRDAKIQLQQGELKQSDEDLGLVPLLHLYGAYLFNDRVSAILDVEGAGAPQGRAIDAALKLRYDWPSGWSASAGYRTLEGGADNDSVYTFAWLHYALLSVGYRF